MREDPPLPALDLRHRIEQLDRGLAQGQLKCVLDLWRAPGMVYTSPTRSPRVHIRGRAQPGGGEQDYPQQVAVGAWEGLRGPPEGPQLGIVEDPGPRTVLCW